MKKNKKVQVEFSASNCLFREFLRVMKLNYTKSLFVYSKDKYGNEVSQSWCLSKKDKKSIPNFIS